MSDSVYMEFKVEDGFLKPIEPEVWKVQKKKFEGKHVVAVFEILTMRCSKGQRGLYRWYRDVVCSTFKMLPREYDREMAELFIGYKEYDAELPNGTIEPRRTIKSYKELDKSMMHEVLTKIYIHWTEQGITLPVPKEKNADNNKQRK